MTDYADDWVAEIWIRIVAYGLVAVVTVLVFLLLGGQDDKPTRPVPAEAAPAAQVRQLTDRKGMPWGLVKIKVDGRTFLLWSNTYGSAITEYEPADPSEGND